MATRPLALCDAASVRPEELVVFEIHYADRIGENYFAKHDARHRWVYWSAMTRDEALLIKQWDSAGELARSRGARADADGDGGDGGGGGGPCTFSFHSAFEDPATPARRAGPLEHRGALRRAVRVTRPPAPELAGGGGRIAVYNRRGRGTEAESRCRSGRSCRASPR